ncbi:PhoD-like phosphatase [Marinomonas spartinae]|uniref:alkaline phosphatase D family protein n=1 Tax=Marinomonas spartinae TaxID=1792290 RepID=UPI000808F348|nr:alkaline phosphatase D family protein [Marinomonas spartinae]SBS40067.1 PhoD-like phosphatase [Marinomonas spartinae]
MQTLPLVLAGPILRKTNPHEVTLWLATSQPVDVTLSLQCDGLDASPVLTVNHRQIKSSDKLYFQLIHAIPESALPIEEWIGYDIVLIDAVSKQEHPIQSWAADLSYPGYTTPGFIIQKNIKQLLHGSCRKPHYCRQGDSPEESNTDGLALVDSLLERTPVKEWPAVLLLTGDQIYADDVAGPMLNAIHQVIQQLGLADEDIDDTVLEKHQSLHSSAPHYYERDRILPQREETKELHKQFFGGVKKPIFTSSTAQNHLITLSEVLAMYLLVWSPACWANIDLTCPNVIQDSAKRMRYEKEKQAIEAFKQPLKHVRRALAHLPTAMIFDDHDVTDDWNMTAAWEQSAYGHPLSKRIIGNALTAYLLCQGWGNAPEQFDDAMLSQLDQTLQSVGGQQHDNLIDQLLTFEQWHYEWPTHPPLIVLDTRTHRWRSERHPQRPSGLMDWQTLTDLQQTLIDHKAVIMVSPAPIFGVKLIETVQRIFTFLGKPLVVDAENWMAHSGSAHTLMNLFRHPKTPHHFVILSGDVHYSFVYDIEVKGLQSSPHIWQITSSGLRNEFPKRLLDWFDRLNRWLYAPWSPLNIFTKRRGMWISPRKPDNASRGERLLNRSGIGLVTLDEEGKPIQIQQLTGKNKAIAFRQDPQERRFE